MLTFPPSLRSSSICRDPHQPLTGLQRNWNSGGPRDGLVRLLHVQRRGCAQECPMGVPSDRHLRLRPRFRVLPLDHPGDHRRRHGLPGERDARQRR